MTNTEKSTAEKSFKSGYSPVNGMKMYYEIHGMGQTSNVKRQTSKNIGIVIKDPINKKVAVAGNFLTQFFLHFNISNLKFVICKFVIVNRE